MIVQAKIKFFTAAEGGRKELPTLNYSPHVVPLVTKEYLGVKFIRGIPSYEESVFDLELIYPLVDYTILKNGIKIGIFEGRKMVAEGEIISSDRDS